MIDNISAEVVIDTGASASFLPSEGVVVRQTEPALIQTETDTRIADNGRLDCTHVAYYDVQVWAGHLRKCHTKFYIINKSNHILGYDALFGTDIIKNLNMDIWVRKDVLVSSIENNIIGQEDTIDKYARHLGMISRPRESASSNVALNAILEKYQDVFSEIASGVMKTRAMEILLDSPEMPKAKLRRHSVDDISEIDRQVKSMLERKIIEPSISSYSSTCHLVPKKNGQKRLVINFIPLNRIAVKDHFPLPQITDLLAHLASAKYFCAMDCTEGFWQIPVAKQDRSKTAFITPQGLFQFRRCPFGFTNSPAVFQRAMNDVFQDGLYKRCVIYIDDILVFGTTETETLSNLEWVLGRCKQANIKLKLSKCQFLTTKVKFLGYEVSQGGIMPLKDKCSPWDKMRPQNMKEAQGFLGYINYYSRFIEDFSEKTHLIRRAIQTRPFHWTEQCEQTKKALLEELEASEPQIIPSAESPKVIELAVLDYSIEAMCMTEDNELIMRTSASLSSSQYNYSRLEKELLALARAYDKFGPFLKGNVIVKTSCILLQQTLKLKNKPERVARLLLQLPPDAMFNVETIDNVSSVIQRMTEPPEEVFYTDGATKSEPDKTMTASWAVVAVNRPELNTTGILKDSTNQKAEIEGVIQAISIAKRNGLRNIVVVTDSKYVANAYHKWIDRWENNGWLDNRNRPVKNEEAFKRLRDIRNGLDLNITHVKGHQGDKFNELADRMARERLLSCSNKCAAIYSPPELQQETDEELRMLKEKLKAGELVKNFSLKNEMVWAVHQDRERLLVPKSQRQLLLRLAHSDPIYGAHYGVKKTRKKLDHYHWPGIGTDVASFVSTCDTCQRNKSPKQKAYGKLMPIKTSNLFNRIHMDIIGPMTPSENGNKYIITGIDAFSRFGFARACKMPTADDIIAVLSDEVIYRHGPPENLVTDNGTQFTALRFKAFLAGLGIKHATTCEYHPQANGMDERYNGTLVKIIKNCVGTNKRTWDKVLATSVLAYNLTSNDSTQASPYTVVYGRWPRSPLNPVELETEVEVLDHDNVRTSALAHTQEAQDRMTHQYDKNKQDVSFSPLDLVMVKALSLGRTESRKFSAKWTGPHSVLRLLEHGGKPRALEILDKDRLKVRRVPFGSVKKYNPPTSSDGAMLPGDIIMTNLESFQPSLQNRSSDEGLQLLSDSNREQTNGLLETDSGGHKGVNPLALASSENSHGGVNPPDSRNACHSHEGVNPSGWEITYDSHGGVNPPDLGITEISHGDVNSPDLETTKISHGVVNPPDIRIAKISHGGVNPPDSGTVDDCHRGVNPLDTEIVDERNDCLQQQRGETMEEPRGPPHAEKTIQPPKDTHCSVGANLENNNNCHSFNLSTGIFDQSGSSPQAPTPSTLTCHSPSSNQDVTEHPTELLTERQSRE